MDLIEIMGKRDRKVPVLLKPSIRDTLDLFNSMRSICRIPDTNPYIFAKNKPWVFYEEGSVPYLVHYGLVAAGFILAVITLLAQWTIPAPYGKHASNKSNWGPPIPQRIAHMTSDSLPGVFMFILVFFFYGDKREYTNYIFLVLWLLHYIHRGLIHPLVMRYRSDTVPLGITAGTIFPNILYHFLSADFISNADFENDYYRDPRFVLGIFLYILGYVINRWADWKLRALRNSNGSSGYFIPYGGLFELVTMPNYLGELIEWLGWSIATWSLAGLSFALFGAATFIPRSRHNLAWYKNKFDSYPKNRKALIPYIF